MSNEYSENIIVQQNAANCMKSLGWETVFAFDVEKLGERGTLGRLSYNDILLTRYVREALLTNNDWITDAQCEDAIKKLHEVSSSATAMQTNREKHLLITEGVPVQVKLPNGTQETRHARMINFDKPEQNRFIAVREMKIHGTLYHCRTDIVGYVNGLPLLFIELKRPNADVREAYTDNYTHYRNAIPQLFYYNAFLMLSTGLEARVGTLGSKYEFFQEWKRLNEGEKGSVDLETMLKGICNRGNFLDILRNFILYDDSNGRTVKILARNHQYLGVNEAVKAYANRQFNNGKLGVFWHTQGSGKSYSMVFFTQKVRRTFAGSPTFVVLTDREELNKQISDTFEACGCLGAIEARRFIASSSADLINKLHGNHSYVFTLIQKFNQRDPAPIYPDHDVIILSDEAHRTQNGVFADNMVALLPTASRLGFTGTPLFSNDNITVRTFGGWVSVYDFKRAVEDGATVPLFYENRADKLGIENPDITDRLLDAIESFDLDDNQTAKLESEMAREIHVLTSSKRLDAIARDFVEHYTDLWQTGKAMFVCINKASAVRMYDLAQGYWKDKTAAVEAAVKRAASDQEYQELSRKLAWLKETEMAVIVSQEQNEAAAFNKQGLDILPHREKMIKRDMDDEFKNPNNPFRVAFVCAMWLTGFDVKSLALIYLDKPLKAHTLMQTIARANRVYEGKSNGLIVDYIGVVKALRDALAQYTIDRENFSTDPTFDKAELLQRIVELLNEIAGLMKEHGFDLYALLQAEGFEKLALVKAGANAMCDSMDTRKRFEILARELFRIYKYVNREEITDENRALKNAISAIYDQMQEKRQHADITDLMLELQLIVNEYIEVTTNADVEGLALSRRFDLSKIDFERLREEFARVKNKNLMMKDLQDLVEERLDRMIRTNPTRIDYYDKYQKIIDAYNAEQDQAAIEKTFIDLTNLMNDLDDESKRYARTGFDNDDELAVYDLLMKESLTPAEIKQIKALAARLLENVKAKIRELNNWREKEETRSIINNLIRDVLFCGLPDSYDKEGLNTHKDKVYRFVLENYRAA
ncbi:DEAD/DEAH box helicase [Clostridia bacterium]|nr:DEAD/DEAH box helicase [Clostridia bacterium]